MQVIVCPGQPWGTTYDAFIWTTNKSIDETTTKKRTFLKPCLQHKSRLIEPTSGSASPNSIVARWVRATNIPNVGVVIITPSPTCPQPISMPNPRGGWCKYKHGAHRKRELYTFNVHTIHVESHPTLQKPPRC
jgi:hypothetical protein